MTIQQIASNHNIDTNKENFPLNTIRLFYLIFIYSLLERDQLIEAEKIINSIPLVSSILEKRTDKRLSDDEKNINDEWQIVQPELNKIEELIPGAIVSFEYLFSISLPIQEDLLFNIVTQAQNEGKVFNPNDILSTLKLRSMDSVAYSNLVCKLINKPEHNLAINYLTNLLYQLNDLIDSILYAKEDTENNNFSPFEIIRKSAKDSTEAKSIINSLLKKIIDDKNQVTLPEKTQTLVDEYFALLSAVIGDISSNDSEE